MDEKQLQDLLQNAATNIGQGGAAAQQLVQSLNKLNSQTNTQTTAASAQAQAMQQATQRAASMVQGINGMIGAAVSVTAAFTTIASNIYGADKAFTSVIPTLEALSSTMGKVITALGQMGSGASIAGFSFGEASKAIASFATTAIDIVSGLLRFQLETSQKMADASVEVAKVGASFGGNITELVNQVAGQAGVPLQMFSKMVSQTAEDLGKIGFGMRESAVRVAGLSRRLIDTDDRFIALYGSFDEVSKAVAGYQAIQAQLGERQIRSAAAERQVTGEYLLRQRELSAITGKQADRLRQEEESRRRQLDYTSKLGRLGETARQNVQEGMAVAGKIFGDQGAKYAEEYFATGGRVISQESLTFAAMNKEAADAVAQLMGSVDQSREGYRSTYSTYLKANADILEGSARSLENLAEINRAANNPIIRGMTETGSAVLSNLRQLDDIVRQVTTIESDRMKYYQTTMEKNAAGIVEPVIRALDPAVTAFSTATKEMMNNQLQLDKQINENMKGMTEIVRRLNQVTSGILSNQQAMIDTMKQILDGSVKDAKEALGNLINSMLKKMGVTAIETVERTPTVNIGNFPDLAAAMKNLGVPANPSTTLPANPSKNALGGVVNTPSIAGEDGPEAVIPLAKGKVPMQIDFDPMVRALNENNRLMEDIVRTMSDSKDIQQQILNASY